MNHDHRFGPLFAHTALQLQFVSEEQLSAAIGPTPSTDQYAGVRERLVEQELLTPGEANDIAAIVERQLARTKLAADPAATRANVLATPATPVDGSRYGTRFVGAVENVEEWNRFVVLRPHAQGGLGRVQVAVDRQLNREIALKDILPSHADNASSRQRFVREAEITGSLEHPGVAPVYSLGEYPDGRPFYAMRFIVGQNLRVAIADFHAKSRTAIGADLDSRQLLGRFVDACHAIHYAHNRGVVHRDVKPDNIMLGDYGETLVVDWGLARTHAGGVEPSVALRPITPSARASSSHTIDGEIVGTPAYMSPEQASGRLDLLGPANDVYSLGATLYHLLVGDVPFGGDPEDSIQRVQRGRFIPPREHNRRIPRPLEAICLRAMALQPQNRYPSALALAVDVERYLADEKVEAYAEPAWARAWRWIRNHRTAVFGVFTAATVAIVALTLGVALLGAANQRERAAKNEAVRNFAESVAQRERAEQNFRHAQEAVREYYVKVSEETLLTQPGMQPLRNALLRQALEYYDAFLEQRADNPALRAESAQAAYFAGQITEDISSPEAALPYYQQALDHYELLGDDAGHEADIARVLNAMGGAYHKLHQTTDSRQAYVRARKLRERLATQNPRDAERARELSNTLMNLGSLALLENDAEEGLRLLQHAQSLRLAHLTETSSLKLQRDLAMGYFNLAAAQLSTGQTEEAQRNLIQAEASFAALTESEPTVFQNRRRLALTRRLLADLAMADGELAQAKRYYAQSQTALSQLVAENPRLPELYVDLAGVLMNLAALLLQAGDGDDALAQLRTAAEILEKLSNADETVPRYRRDLGAAQMAIGEILASQAKLREARQTLEAARQLHQSLVREFPSNHDYAAQLQATDDALKALTASEKQQ